ncbi:MAG: serine hydrolase domain-containing protein [Acidimicrobiales bacterium]
MDSLSAVSAWPVSSVAAGVLVGPGGTGRVAVVGDADRAYPWASVTKLCSALAVLVAVEEGTVALEDPAGPPGSSVAHLLAHASGLSFSGDAVLAAPGRRRIYSNAGYELLAAHLEARTGLGFATYLREAVLDPLSMSGCRFGPGDSAGTGLTGTLGDLLALAAELMAPRLVAPATLALATTVAFPGLDGVLPGFGFQRPCDWGLGFELRDDKHPHWTGGSNSPGTFGHFGRSGTFVWVDPAAAVGCAVLTDTAFGPWAASAWPTLSDAVLAEAAAPGPSGRPVPEPR